MNKKIVMLLVALVGCLGFAANANAEEYGTEFQKLASDGTITITSSSVNSKRDVISQFLNYWNNLNETQFRVQSCNESYDTCTVVLDDNDYEQHDIQIKYEENYSDQFKKVSSGTLAISSTTNGAIQGMLNNYLIGLKDETNSYMIGSCNEDKSICDIARYEPDKTGGVVEAERHAINITYKEEYSDAFKEVTSSGTITIHGDTVGTQSDMLRNYLGQFSVYAIPSYERYDVSNCNEDATVCDVVRSIVTTGENYSTKEVERHVVKITYDKAVSEKFKAILQDGIIVGKGTTVGNKNTLIFDALQTYSDSKNFYNLGLCNEEQSVCDVILYQSEMIDGNYSSKEVERHAVKVEYNEAYSNQFKQEIGDTITLRGSVSSQYNNQLSIYLNKFSINSNTSSSYYNAENCNDDRTTCDVVWRQSSSNGVSYTERHVVKVVYEAEQFSETFKRLTDSKKITVNSVEPSESIGAYTILNAYLKNYDLENSSFYTVGCNDDYTICDIASTETGEVHALNVNYEYNLDSNISTLVNDMIAKYPNGKAFTLEDLELINYLVHKNYQNWIGDENTQVNFSSEAKAYLGNMTGILECGMGGGYPFGSGCSGAMAIMYNGTIYGTLKSGLESKSILYIPNNTEDTIEAYIAAAQKRINAYLKSEDVKITYGGKVSEFVDDESAQYVSENLGYDISKIENYYNVTYDGNTFEFLIIKDSSKIQEEVEYKNNDIITGISISTTSSDVPLDAIIQINEITKENTQYQEITSRLKVTEALIYDLKLFSSTARQFISKLSDGLFNVRIPLPTSMLNKDLAAYYIREDGKVEIHPITVMDGYANFTTDHFSIYTIAEKREIEDAITEQVPNTYDGIMNYVGLGALGLIGLSITGIAYKKKENE